MTRGQKTGGHFSTAKYTKGAKTGKGTAVAQIALRQERGAGIAGAGNGGRSLSPGGGPLAPHWAAMWFGVARNELALGNRSAAATALQRGLQWYPEEEMAKELREQLAGDEE